MARFGILHERELNLSEEGYVLTGVDRFFGPKGEKVRDTAQDAVAVRFHLHPDIELFRDDRDRLVLGTPQQERWTLASPDVAPVVEDSIFFASIIGPRRTRQIVLSFRASQLHQVRWRFTRSSR